MGEHKYYTPAPEDIRIGMLCEFNTLDAGWETRVLNRYSVLIATNEDNKVRVPYLTAEQMEAEGWVRYAKNAFSREKLCLIIIGGNRVVIRTEADILYHGSCRCINDLRTISKLLGI